MPYFVFQGVDAPDSAARRAGLRDAHRAYIRRDAIDCRTVLGGPLLTEDAQMFSTLLVFEAEDRAAVVRFMRDDPYMRGGLFASVSVDQWLWGLGQPT
ncbi:YciI family protein [Sphingomonas fuzhouensis]|uniref:YciI family protein n=1 Tax=Sphingomonas fuzhouensis TaxID=3106033 RepID=UPI002AFFB9BD|nr:YciI family protein [Sphingomonas sp. SGZ-02]